MYFFWRQSRKNFPWQNFLHGQCLWCPWQISGMNSHIIKILFLSFFAGPNISHRKDSPLSSDLDCDGFFSHPRVTVAAKPLLDLPHLEHDQIQISSHLPHLKHDQIQISSHLPHLKHDQNPINSHLAHLKHDQNQTSSHIFTKICFAQK